MKFEWEDECGTKDQLKDDATEEYLEDQSTHLGEFDWVFVVEPMGAVWPGKLGTEYLNLYRQVTWVAKLEISEAGDYSKRPTLVRVRAGAHKNLFKLPQDWLDICFWGPTYEQAMTYMEWFTSALLQIGPNLTFAVMGGGLKTDVLPVCYDLCGLGADVTLLRRYCFPDEMIYPNGVDCRRK